MVSFNGIISTKIYRVAAKDVISENKVKEVETKMIGFPFYTSFYLSFVPSTKCRKWFSHSLWLKYNYVKSVKPYYNNIHGSFPFISCQGIVCKDSLITMMITRHQSKSWSVAVLLQKTYDQVLIFQAQITTLRP